MDDGDRMPEGRTIAFPDLTTLAPAITGHRYTRVRARVVAFYQAVSQQLGRTELPYVDGVWISPDDYNRPSTWVERPNRHTSRKTRGLAWFWLDKGPSVSQHVSASQIVVTEPAYPERAP